MAKLYKKGAGFILLDAVVALFLLALLASTLFSLYLTGRTRAQLAGRRLEALQRAQAWLEVVKGTPWSQFGVVQGSGKADLILEGKSEAVAGTSLVAVTGGPGAGQVRAITGYDPVTHTAAVAPPWSDQPAPAGSTYLIFDNPGGQGCQVVVAQTAPDLFTITVTASYRQGEGVGEVCLTTEKLRR